MNPDTKDTEGWHEYRKLILNELSRMNKNHDSMVLMIQDVARELAEIRKDIQSGSSSYDKLTKRVEVLEAWRSAFVIDYTTFKTKMVIYTGIAAVLVNGLIGVGFWLMKTSLT